MRRGTPRRRPGEVKFPGKVALIFTIGVVGGLLLGYILLATAHAVMTSHIHTVDTAAGAQVIKLGEVSPRPFQERRPVEHVVLAAVDPLNTETAAADVPLSKFPTKGNNIHTLATSNGSPYLNFQNRIMYQTYKMVQKMPGGERLVAFTRILHRSTPDVLIDEVPTFRADPLTPKCDTWCEFPVSDRPNAVAQFFAAAHKDPSMIKAPWLLMIETDYVWLKPPLPPPAEDTRAPSWAFHFNYIVPTAPELDFVMRKMFPHEYGPVAKIPASGPAPVMMRVHEWVKVWPPASMGKDAWRLWMPPEYPRLPWDPLWLQQ